MSDFVVDPDDDNTAIMCDTGNLGFGVRIVKVANPTMPLVSELRDAPIIGYADSGQAPWRTA